MTEMPGLGCIITNSHVGPMGMHAIEAVALKKELNILIPRLRAAGAKNIMEISLVKFID
jgi:HisG, C-terminal domain